VALLGKPEGAAFEASCILRVGEYLYTVSDDVPGIGKIHESLQYNHKANTLIQPKSAADAGNTDEGGFEAIVYDKESNVFHVVVEAVNLGEQNVYHSVIKELQFNNDDTYSVLNECPSTYEFSSANKGFEGAAYVKDSKGQAFMLGLCEGNFCEGGVRGRTSGNGRIVVLKRDTNVAINGKSYPCAWVTQRVIELPHTIQFMDYSALSIRGKRVAIASQENSQVFIGTFDADTFQISDKDARILNLPRDDDCDIQYCNVEGLDWIGENMLAAASDQMKDMGRQSYHCLAKDQSVHVFVIPDAYIGTVDEGETKGKKKQGKIN